jgi:hypothetical protein
MFASDTQCLSCVLHVLGVNHICMCAYCVLLLFPAIESNDECAEEGRSLSIKRKEIRDKPLKASHLLVAYLNPNITPCIVLPLFILLCIVFYIAIILYIAIVGDLAPQVDLISSIEMTPLVTYSTPLLLET